jgi:hypothetical protein
MSEKEGTLRMQPSGQWAVCRPGKAPVEITSGEVVRVEDPGREGLHRTRMERDVQRPRLSSARRPARGHRRRQLTALARSMAISTAPEGALPRLQA